MHLPSAASRTALRARAVAGTYFGTVHNLEIASISTASARMMPGRTLPILSQSQATGDVPGLLLVLPGVVALVELGRIAVGLALRRLARLRVRFIAPP